MKPLPALPPLPAALARTGVVFPALALGARVLESTFGRPTCFGRACIGRGSSGYNEILLTLLGLGALAALRTGIAGPSRGLGLLGLVVATVALLAPAFELECPALRALWP